MSNRDRERVWPAVAQGGRAHLVDETTYRRWFAETYGEGEAVEIVVRPEAKTRSLRQNAAFHAAITPWADDLGEDIEDLKDELLGIVFGYREEVSHLTGEIRKVLVEPHTSKLDSEKFSHLMERTMEIAARMGFQIESPAEYNQRRYGTGKVA